jgi:excisionase family DNA binding protein
MANENAMLTPPELAKRWGVAADKVLHLIHTGQLRAINLAQDPKGRPRYRIYMREVERFEEARSTK